jgi:hypothetical protein
MGAIRMGVISKMFRLQPAAPQQQPLPEAPPAPDHAPARQDQPAGGTKKRKRHKKK